MSELVRKTIKRELSIPLNEEQLNVRREECANLQSVVDEHQAEMDKAEAEFKAKKDEHKPAIESAEHQKAVKLREIKQKKAPMLVECDQVIDFTAGTVHYEYNGEEYDSRSMDKDEYQRDMFEKEAEDMPESGMDIPGN